MIVYFFICFLIIVINSIVDAKKIQKKKIINHKKTAIIIGLLLLQISIILYFMSDVNFYIWFIYCVTISISIRIGFYDFMRNEVLGLPLNYVCNYEHISYVSKKEFWYDNFLQKNKINPNNIRLVFALISFIIFGYIQIL